MSDTGNDARFVGTTSAYGLVAMGAGERSVHQAYPQILELLKRIFGAENHLLAEPIRRQGASDIDWYTPAPGAICPFAALEADRQRWLVDEVSRRLSLIEKAIESLKVEATQDASHYASLLERAIIVPDDNSLWLVGNEPVITGWGFRKDSLPDGMKLRVFIERESARLAPPPPDEPVVAPPPPPPHPMAPPTAKRPVALAAALAITLAIAIGAAVWWLINHPSPPPLPQNPGFAAADPSKIKTDENDPLKRSIVINRMVVTLKMGVDARAFMERAREQYRGALWFVGYRPEIGLVQVEFADGDFAAVAKLLSANGDVENVGPEAVLATPLATDDAGLKDPASGDAKRPKDWGLRAIGAMKAWDASLGDPGTLVAVIDAGFAPTHPEFAGKRLTTLRMTDGGAQLGRAGDDCGLGHGTNVSGIATGTANNKLGVAGSCPNCGLMMIDAADDQAKLVTSGVFNGVVAAVNAGAKVINMSLGGMSPEKKVYHAVSPELRAPFVDMVVANTAGEANQWERVYRYASDRGVVIVQAAGNETAPMILDPMKRSAYPIYVAATDVDRELASFSNYGDTVTVSAPGVGIYNAIPPDKFGMCNGTSMASPLVAGAVGLLRSIKPELGPNEVKKLLASTGAAINNGKGSGPQIDLAAAVAAIAPQTTCDCAALRRRIADLERELGKGGPSDEAKLKLPDGPQNNLDFAKGRWRASNQLTRASDKLPIDLLFDIKNDGDGEIIYAESSGVKCRAPLKLTFVSRQLHIKQTDEAPCDSGDRIYSKFNFTCIAGDRAVAACKAEKDGSHGESIIDFSMERD